MASELAQEVFRPELLPLPASDPSFALPLVHEDPHFRPDYASAQFELQQSAAALLGRPRPPRAVVVSHPAHLGGPSGSSSSRPPEGFKFVSSHDFPTEVVESELGKKKKKTVG